MRYLIILLFLFSFNVFSNDFENTHQDYEYIKSKLEEHKKILEDYENNSQYYGRSGLDISSHTKANIRMYEKMLEEIKNDINISFKQ